MKFCLVDALYTWWCLCSENSIELCTGCAFLFLCFRMSFCCVIIRLWVKAFSLSRIKAETSDGGFPCDHKACSVEQWPSTCQSAVLCGGAEIEPCGSLSGWAGLGVNQCVQSSMKVIWNDFFIYMSSGCKVWGGRRRSGKTRAKKQVWQELKHQQCEAPSEMTGRWRPDY